MGKRNVNSYADYHVSTDEEKVRVVEMCIRDRAKAIGKGKKLVQEISAVYTGEVTLPETEGYIWKCEYAEKIPESQQTVYTMAVDVSYEQANACLLYTSG